MPTNIINTDYINGLLSITADNARRLVNDGEDKAGGNFLDEIDLTTNRDIYEIEHPWWQGDYSSGSLDYFRDTVLAATTGSADILIVYEEGSLEGLRVEDGRVTGCNVEVVLTPPGVNG